MSPQLGFRVLVSLCMLVAATILPEYAQAQRTDQERARDHFEAGTSYFEQRRYVEAATQFRDSYALSSHPELLLNIATSLELSLIHI